MAITLLVRANRRPHSGSRLRACTRGARCWRTPPGAAPHVERKQSEKHAEPDRDQVEREITIATTMVVGSDRGASKSLVVWRRGGRRTFKRASAVLRRHREVNALLIIRIPAVISAPRRRLLTAASSAAAPQARDCACSPLRMRRRRPSRCTATTRRPSTSTAASPRSNASSWRILPVRLLRGALAAPSRCATDDDVSRGRPARCRCPPRRGCPILRRSLHRRPFPRRRRRTQICEIRRGGR